VYRGTSTSWNAVKLVRDWAQRQKGLAPHTKDNGDGTFTITVTCSNEATSSNVKRAMELTDELGKP
jgi:hypothetical protein